MEESSEQRNGRVAELVKSYTNQINRVSVDEKDARIANDCFLGTKKNIGENEGGEGFYKIKSEPARATSPPPMTTNESRTMNAAAEQSPFVEQVKVKERGRETRKRTVKDFFFGRTLGEGSYSTVVEATEVETEKIYAAKILDKRHIIKEKKTKYVTIERNVLHKLRHPFIVRLHYAFQDKQSLYFILDLAANGELLSWVRKYGGLSEPVAKHYMAELILAVEYMHQNGVVHRDLKPENILLGSDMHILIADFGTAKLLGENDGSRTNSFVGTAEYVSPELLMDRQEANIRGSDIWALGCIAYQLLAGRPPFKATNEYQTFQKILKNEYEFPPHFSVHAKDFIRRILVLDPNYRLGCCFFKDSDPDTIPNFDDLKSHPFFTGIDWSNLSNSNPPQMSGLLSDSSSKKLSTLNVSRVSIDNFSVISDIKNSPVHLVFNKSSVVPNGKTAVSLSPFQPVSIAAPTSLYVTPASSPNVDYIDAVSFAPKNNNNSNNPICKEYSSSTSPIHIEYPTGSNNNNAYAPQKKYTSSSSSSLSSCLATLKDIFSCSWCKNSS
ncbi:3-phosphoinositide-dependent protein kinase 1 [Zancudomyces culisetae]|uniref:non-specific serine/threonine protein kinase n=1 Tax=Zancudomyces culisetae TaxID=1213189 RepID=A0A1R1PXD9_ZANCU|nr:3-phosphoinositide-dependent protein kinase 1 [Zancudomyces culisetae]|eukprot:OMH85641.1 3-phosphoinositide-dependent protein kinase 1 [Zancudomyces culisetae]